ncbi:LLM class flavin-dependent oxidoreductase [Micromonospora craniellae]|uniref:LLM class flavin-dependent oxidoreductase n=1 Tax=Micromonospora craniellae TaxID=2294034 RepID=A0A372FZB4_9ACTN|nr:LLM class flavin-dependent oxidoreductase [Micromonospora craniellae]QOC93419.1 LLM class flavin-dependent oxidoreductase [Micromonospora craniellae]RFS45866.1 LLM class flavin-dependent oxidoreductase [Micromonospora craniellae]
MTAGVSVGIRVPPCRPATEVADFAAEVERLGFDTLYVPDSQLLWRDGYLSLLATALRTSRIGLGTAVTNVVTRHPSVVASAARTVAEAAEGRFRLGLGVGNSSVEPVGLSPSKQAELRAGIDTIRGLLAGAEASFNGVSGRLRDPFPGIPINVAASGPRNLQFAGEVSDGVILLSGVAPVLLERSVHLVRQGAETAGRNPDDVQIIVAAHAMVTDDLERDARILKPVCAGIAQKGGRAALATAGIDIEVPAQVPGVYPDLIHAEDWELAVDRCAEWVSDEDAVAFAQTFCLFGTAEEIVTKIEAANRLGATAIFLQHVGSYDFPEQLASDVATQVLPRLADRAD